MADIRTIKVITRSGRLPEYETQGSAGMDIRAYLEVPVILGKGERALIPTGLFLEIPAGCEVQIRARSGLAIKHGISLINGIGTIDSDYRGEVMVPVINLGDDGFVIRDGDRIAQMVLCTYERAILEKVEELDDTARGQGGFGSTGTA